MEESKELDQKKEHIQNKIKRLLKNKSLFFLIALILFSFIVNIYFFSQTKNQPLWWDEAEYMSMAKKFVFNIPYDLNPQRPPLFPFFASLLFRLGLSEASMRFILVVIPSFLALILTYFFIKEVYDEKIALISAFITSVSWIHIFYSMRFMTDSLGLLFGLAAFYCFWKGYLNKGPRFYTWLVGPLVSLSAMIRLTGLLYGLVIFVFLIITDKFKFIKSKDLWISFIASLLFFAPLLIYDQIVFNNLLAFRSAYGGVPNQGLGWQLISEVYNYPEQVFFFAFLLGLAISIPTLFSLDLIIKKSEKKHFGDIFMILSILITLAFFIYFLRQAENRWLILMSIGIFALAAKGIMFIYSKLSKSKTIAFIFIIAILLLGAYFQLTHANGIIQIKKDSYSQIKDAALWIKENSNQNDVILSVSLPQTIYYSERKVYTYSEMNKTVFLNLLKDKKPTYILLSVFEPHHPQWLIQQNSFPNGDGEIDLSYFNSSVRYSAQGQISQVNLKQRIQQDGITYTLVYPKNSITGVFVYKISY